MSTNNEPQEKSGQFNTHGSVIKRQHQRLNKALELESIDKFSFEELFSETLKHRDVRQIEELYLAGGTSTTPDITEVQTGWPKPWLFVRTFGFMAMSYATLVTSFYYWENINLIPGIIFIGCFAMPITVVTFFFELNSPRNVSYVSLIRALILGGTLALMSALILFENTRSLEWLGDSVAGIAEEPAKLIALLLISRQGNYPYILNGLLLGAAVGAGFAAFESMGYAFQVLLATGTHNDYLNNISLRGLLSPFAHIAWTAMIGGALWRVMNGNKFNISMLTEPKFWKVFLYAVILHSIWNLPFELPLMIKYAVLGLASWVVLLGLFHEGYMQVQKVQQNQKFKAG
jgi:RsiW-degrading membrane proteinase PrsW (M82 family)